MNLAADIKRSQASTTEPSQRDNHANWDQQGHQEAVKANMTLKIAIVSGTFFLQETTTNNATESTPLESL